MKLVIGISGASGSIYGIRLLEMLKDVPAVETHLIISEAAGLTVELETGWSADDIRKLASVNYENSDIGAAIASGSCDTGGMVIAPCSVKTMSAIATSFSHNLMARAADVTLKERRKLVLVVRETPLHLGHLRAMTAITETGGIILPPVPAFYHQPQTVTDIVDQTAGKILDQFGIAPPSFRRWQGKKTG